MSNSDRKNVNFPHDNVARKSIYATAGIGILMTDAEGKILSANPAACQLFGKDESTMCSLDWNELTVTLKAGNGTSKTQLDIDDDGIFQFERSDGTTFTGQVSVKKIHTDDNDKRIILSINDISMRISTEKLLQESEDQYRRTLDNIIEGCQIIGSDWRYIYLNKIVIEQSRKTKEELYGHTVMEAFPGIEDTEIFSAMRDCMDNRTARVIESIFNYEDGEECFLELSIQPVTEGILLLSVDVTERKRAEERLRGSEENLRLMINNAPAAIAIFDKDMKYLYASRRFYTDYGISEENIVGLSHYEVFPEITDEIKDMHKKCIEGESFSSDAEPFPRADGSTDWVRWEIIPWRNHKGNIGGVILFSEVITAQKRAEEALQASEQRWRFALEGSGDGIMDYDCVENRIFFSKRWKSMLGYSNDEITDTVDALIDIIHPEDKEWALTEIERIFNGEVPNFSREYRLMCKNGSYKWILARGMVISSDKNGKPTRIIGTHTDISSLKNAQESLKRSNRAYKLLSSCNEHLVRATSESGLLNDICRVIVEQGGYNCAWVCLAQDGDNLTPVAKWGSECDLTHGKKCDKTNKHCIAHQAIDSRTPIVLQNTIISPENAPMINDALNGSNASLVAQPIINDGAVLGALNIYSSEQNSVSEDELAILTEFADDLAYGLSVLRLQNRNKSISEKLMASENKYRTLFESSSEAIIIGDVEASNIELANPAACKMLGYSLEEFKNLSTMDVYPENNTEYVLSELELQFKGIKTVSADIPLRRKDGTIIYTDINAARMVIGGKEVIAAFITDITQRRIADKEREAFEGKLLKAMTKTVELISRTVEFRDPYTAGHQERVTVLAVAIAKKLGLSESEVEGIRMAAIVHDVGKICIPSEILNRPGHLSELEFGIIKTHPQAGYDILKDAEFPWPIADIVLQHHERINGSGYPNSVAEPNINLGARILAVADVVDAMVSHRPYRPSLGIECAMEEISDNRGILYDEDVVAQCIDLFEKGFKFD